MIYQCGDCGKWTTDKDLLRQDAYGVDCCPQCYAAYRRRLARALRSTSQEVDAP